MAKMSRDEIKRLQEIIGTDVDGIWGPKSRAAYSAWLDKSSQPSETEDTFIQPTNLFEGHQYSAGYTPDEFEQNLSRADGVGSDPSAKSGFDPADSFVAPQMDNLYDKSTRIAEIQRRLDEIKREKEKYDVEEKMGEYKFIYDADPSTYTTYKQNLRNSEQTNAIRNASEAATRESNLQTAWKQNGIDLEVARYDLAAAQNAYNEAKGNSDVPAMNRAITDIKRAQAKYDRVSRENDTLRGKMMNLLGISIGDEQKLDNLDNGGTGYTKDLADAESIKKLDGTLELLDKDIIVDNVNVDKRTKIANVNKWLADIKKAKKDVDASSLSTEQKNARKAKLADLEAKVRAYAKSQAKGGQGTNLTKEDYERSIDGKNDLELAKLGYAYLSAARAAGVAVSNRALSLAKSRNK